MVDGCGDLVQGLHLAGVANDARVVHTVGETPEKAEAGVEDGAIPGGNDLEAHEYSQPCIRTGL